MIFFLHLLYAGCIVGLWIFLNSSYTFLEGQRIIQGNSAQHCCSLSWLRFHSASAAREERCSLKASQLSVSQPEAACSTSPGEEMAHGGLFLLGSQGSQLDLVRGHVDVSSSCPWCNAVEAVLPQRLAGLRWDAEGGCSSGILSHQAGLRCCEKGILLGFCSALQKCGPPALFWCFSLT